MKRRKINLSYIIFFLPIIILFIITWKGYTNELKEHGKPGSSYIKGIYYTAGGSNLIVLTEANSFEHLSVSLLDASSGKLFWEKNIKANVFGLLPHLTYHNDSLLLPTYNNDSGLQLNLVSEDEIKELTEGGLLVQDYLTGGLEVWRNRLLIAGDTGGTEQYFAQAYKGKFLKLDLTASDLFPSRPTAITFVTDLKNEYPFPLLEVNLKDGRIAHMEGFLQQEILPQIRVADTDEGTFRARDEAALQFISNSEPYKTQLIHEQSEYPGEAYFYDAVTQENGKTLATPNTVYQARVFPLNENETLIAGSTTPDELDGNVNGYLYNEEKGDFTDVSSMLSQLSYEEITDPDTGFYKETGSKILYFSHSPDRAGWLDVSNNKVELLSSSQLNDWMFKPSLTGIWRYLTENVALAVNLAIWLMLFLVAFLFLLIAPSLSKLRMKRLLSGILTTAEIIELSETGTYINEQPLVRLTVRFEDNGQIIEREVKMLVSVLEPPQRGEQVLISYDRRKKKASLITNQEAEELHRKKEGPSSY